MRLYDIRRSRIEHLPQSQKSRHLPMAFGHFIPKGPSLVAHIFYGPEFIEVKTIHISYPLEEDDGL